MTNMTNTTPTIEVMRDLQGFFDFANERIFDGRLPQCMLTLHARKNVNGYFSRARFVCKDDSDSLPIHHIAMNPDRFDRSTEAILATLVHEMVHLWQEEFGKAPKRPYHNKEWAAKMDEVGLPPLCPKGSGKRTGVHITHTIDPDGRFQEVVEEWIDMGRSIDWYAVPNAEKKKATGLKKYICISCNLTARGKPNIKIECVNCKKLMEPEDAPLDTIAAIAH